MDYTIENNSRLFDELLQALNNHPKEPGIIEALEYLQAARVNYVQRSIDHMVNCLVLVVHELFVHQPSPALLTDLRSVIDRFFMRNMQAGSRLTELADEYRERGGSPLSHDEILKEVYERRGTSR